MKSVAMIQAHMASTRLPNKVMLDLQGKSVLYHVYKRCEEVSELNDIIILTSENIENDAIEEFCIKYGFKCFRGSESDVLDRYYQCSKIYKSDIVVRVTSDCPLLEPKLIQFGIEKIIKDDIEFFDWEKPVFLGSGIDIFTMKALEKLKKNSTKLKQKEHVIGYFLDNPNEFNYKKYLLPKELDYAYSRHRLTLDTPNDLYLFQQIYKKFYKDDEVIDLKEVLQYLDNCSDIDITNKSIKQKDYFEDNR